MLPLKFDSVCSTQHYEEEDQVFHDILYQHSMNSILVHDFSVIPYLHVITFSQYVNGMGSMNATN